MDRQHKAKYTMRDTHNTYERFAARCQRLACPDVGALRDCRWLRGRGGLLAPRNMPRRFLPRCLCTNMCIDTCVDLLVYRDVHRHVDRYVHRHAHRLHSGLHRNWGCAVKIQLFIEYFDWTACTGDYTALTMRTPLIHMSQARQEVKVVREWRECEGTVRPRRAGRLPL